MSKSDSKATIDREKLQETMSEPLVSLSLDNSQDVLALDDSSSTVSHQSISLQSVTSTIEQQSMQCSIAYEHGRQSNNSTSRQSSVDISYERHFKTPESYQANDDSVFIEHSIHAKSSAVISSLASEFCDYSMETNESGPYEGAINDAAFISPNQICSFNEQNFDGGATSCTTSSVTEAENSSQTDITKLEETSSVDTPSYMYAGDDEMTDCLENDLDVSCDGESLPPGGKMPDIYDTNNMSHSERYSAYVNQVKIHKRPNVWDAISDYLSRTCPRQGWLAVCKICHGDGSIECDLIVRVVDMDYKKLESIIQLYEPTICNPPTSISDILQVKMHLAKNNHQVSLLDLYPVFNSKSPRRNERISVAIENIRFFLLYIHRGWDEEDQDDFPLNLLKLRLQLYYDMKDNVPEEVSEKFFSFLTEYQETHNRYTELNMSLRVSDSETELDEMEVCQIVEHHNLLQTLKQPLQMWENPMLRATFCNASKSKKENCHGLSSLWTGEKVTYIVTSRLSLRLIQSLDPEIRLKHYETPGGALLDCHHGDDILLYPGTYPGDGFSDLTESVVIQGISDNPGDCVIKSGKCGDVFVDTSSDHVTIKNVTFLPDNKVSSHILCVRRGHLTLENCILDCNGGRGIYMKEWTQLTLKNCTIKNSKTWGMEVYETSTVIMDGCCVTECGNQSKGGAMLIKCVGKTSCKNTTSIVLRNCTMDHNDGYGLLLDKTHMEEDGGNRYQTPVKQKLSRQLTEASIVGIMATANDLLDLCEIIDLDNLVLKNNMATNVCVASCHKADDNNNESSLWGEYMRSITPMN